MPDGQATLTGLRTSAPRTLRGLIGSIWLWLGLHDWIAHLPETCSDREPIHMTPWGDLIFLVGRRKEETVDSENDSHVSHPQWWRDTRNNYFNFLKAAVLNGYSFARGKRI